MSEKIIELEREHKKFNKEYSETITCRLCKAEMPVRFHKDGTPMMDTKLYKETQDNGGITHQHKDVLMCYDVMVHNGMLRKV